MSAINGEMTNVVPGRETAANWKIRLLPEPVGMTTNA